MVIMYKTKKLSSIKVPVKEANKILGKIELINSKLILNCEFTELKDIYVVIEERTGLVVPPIFSFICNHHIDKGNKSSSMEARALRLYFDFLADKKLKWNIGSDKIIHRPIKKFSSWLEKQFEEGAIAGSTATNYFNAVTRFYFYHLCIKTPFESTPIEFREFSFNNLNNDPLAHLVGRSYTKITSDCNPRISSTITSSELKPLSEADLKFFIYKLKKHSSEEFFLIVILSLMSGLRAGEIGDLRTDMFNEHDDEQKAYLLKLGPQQNHKTKHNSELPVLIPTFLVSIIKKYTTSSQYLKKLNKFFKKGKTRGNVFLTRHGNPYSQHTISTLFNQFLHSKIYNERPNFDYKFHDLRVTFGVQTMAAALNVDGLSKSEALAYTQVQMRHKYLSETLKYLNYYHMHLAIIEQANINENLLEKILEEAF